MTASLLGSSESPQHEHGENDITVLAAHIDVAQTVVGDGPDERDDFIVSGMVQRKGLLESELRKLTENLEAGRDAVVYFSILRKTPKWPRFIS